MILVKIGDEVAKVRLLLLLYMSYNPEVVADPSICQLRAWTCALGRVEGQADSLR